MKTRLSLSNEAGRRQALKRFGYAEAPPADDAIDLEHEWRLLAPGIDPALADVPLNRLEPAKQALIRPTRPLPKAGRGLIWWRRTRGCGIASRMPWRRLWHPAKRWRLG